MPDEGCPAEADNEREHMSQCRQLREAEHHTVDCDEGDEEPVLKAEELRRYTETGYCEQDIGEADKRSGCHKICKARYEESRDQVGHSYLAEDKPHGQAVRKQVEDVRMEEMV